MALSADGNTALIGGPGDDGDVGAAWVFTRSGAPGRSRARSSPAATRAAPAFGTSVALSADGNTALIGGPATATTSRRGVGVHAHGRDLDASRARSSPAAARLGEGDSATSVALSGDGNTALIGGPATTSEHGRGVGVHAHGRDLDPAGPELTGGGESGDGASAAAWRSPRTATRR